MAFMLCKMKFSSYSQLDKKVVKYDSELHSISVKMKLQKCHIKTSIEK